MFFFFRLEHLFKLDSKKRKSWTPLLLLGPAGCGKTTLARHLMTVPEQDKTCYEFHTLPASRVADLQVTATDNENATIDLKSTRS